MSGIVHFDGRERGIGGIEMQLEAAVGLGFRGRLLHYRDLTSLASVQGVRQTQHGITQSGPTPRAGMAPDLLSAPRVKLVGIGGPQPGNPLLVCPLRGIIWWNIRASRILHELRCRAGFTGVFVGHLTYCRAQSAQDPQPLGPGVANLDKNSRLFLVEQRVTRPIARR